MGKANKFKTFSIIVFIVLSVFFGRIFVNTLISELFLSLALMVLLYTICDKYFQNERLLNAILVFAILIRFVVIYISLIIPEVVIPSDVAGYQDKGLSILHQWLSGNILYIEGGGTSGKFQFIYYWYNAMCFLIFGENFVIPRLLNAFFGILAGAILFSLVRKLWNNYTAKITIVLYCFFPSIVYWQTMNLKESIIVLLIVVSVKELLSFKEVRTIKFILKAAIFSIILAFLRIYLGLILLIIVAILFIYYSKFSISKKIIVVGISILVLGVSTWTQGYGFFGLKLLSMYNVESLDFIRKNSYLGGSQVLTNYDTSTIPKLLKFIPISFTYFWLAPFIWQWKSLPNIYAKLAAAENLVLFIGYIVMVIPGIIILLRRKIASSMIILIVIIAFSMPYIVSYGNMGIGIRMRDQILPLIIIFGSVGFYELKSRGNIKNCLIEVKNAFYYWILAIKYPLLKRIIIRRLTYLEPKALIELANTIAHLESKQVKGVFIEAGCALGGSSIAIGSIKNKNRSLFIYDVFDMIPAPTENDDYAVRDRYNQILSGTSKGINGDEYYGYMNDLMNKVVDSFSEFGLNISVENIHLIKGLFEDTMKIDQLVAFAHIDCDWYESVLTCLKQIEPNLVQDGRLIIDDYNSWTGCKKAVDEYFIDKREKYEFIMLERLHIIRK